MLPDPEELLVIVAAMEELVLLAKMVLKVQLAPLGLLDR